MRYFTNKAIKNTMADKERLYEKLASYTPDEKLTREDIGTLLFILRQYSNELESILDDREKAARLMNK